MRHAPLVLILLAGTATASAQEVAADPAFAGLPGIGFTYYDVTGASAAALRASLDAQRTVDANDGKPVDAISHWRIRWRWQARADGKGGCTVADTQMTFDGDVRMPRLAPGIAEQLSQDLRAQWHAYAAALAAHEAGHLRYAFDHMGDVEAAIRGSDCADVQAAAQAALAAIRRHDADYDRETQHGIAQGARFPDPAGQPKR
jgi:predicted secreted Zn-dependent protease